MDRITYLDELVEYPALVIEKLSKNQMIVDLLVNKKNANLNDLIDEGGNWKNFYDYDYIPGTTQEAMAAVCIDTDIIDVPTYSQKTLELYVSVMCARSIMRLDRKIYPSIRGNRMDNLIRFIDYELRLDRNFGIGKMALKNARTTTSGNSMFAKKTLTYSIPDFNLIGG